MLRKLAYLGVTNAFAILRLLPMSDSDKNTEILALRHSRRPRYPSDMTDSEWAVVRQLLPAPAWMRGRGGQPEAYCHSALLDAIRYLVDNGIKWRAMPADFPPWDRAYAFFRRWRDHGLIAEFHDRLRDRVRIHAGRHTEPTAAMIDSQSVKADAVVGA